MIFCMQGGQSLSSAPNQRNGFAGFVGHEVADHANGFGETDGEVGGHLGHLLQRLGLDARLDSLTEQPEPILLRKCTDVHREV